MATTNPLHKTLYPGPAAEPVSVKTFYPGGIATYVYGLSELPSGTEKVTVIWLLHPRLETYESMAPFASAVIRNQQRKGALNTIGVAWDARNHGARLLDEQSNGSWRDGNEDQ
jgi:hypothetical protein